VHHTKTLWALISIEWRGVDDHRLHKDVTWWRYLPKQVYTQLVGEIGGCLQRAEQAAHAAGVPGPSPAKGVKR
jgi:hypothetical protein